jgi:hypothetical protein
MQKISGVEGPDIPFHLKLLGLEVKVVDRADIHFIPLVNHYNKQSICFMAEQMRRAHKSKCIVLYDLLNIGDWELDGFIKTVNAFDHPNKIYLTVNQSRNIKVNCPVIHWDFMWNRFLAYYFEQCIDGLHHYTEGAYNLFDIDYVTERSKLFMSLYRRKEQTRDRLYNILKNDNGYISNIPAGIELENDLTVPGYKPVDNRFYKDSYFSVYVESNYSRDDLIHVTEKTYEPLLKGHIPLPYVNTGSIDYLKTKGFQFPIELNYEYDCFSSFINEYKKLSKDLYMANIDKVKQNREVFLEKKYDRSILQIFE